MVHGGPPPPPPPHQIFSNGKKNKGKLYIILKGVYQKFRIILNNRKITEFSDFGSDFARWSQESRWVEIGQNFKVFLFDKML